jgi:hypothetical protein
MTLSIAEHVGCFSPSKWPSSCAMLRRFLACGLNPHPGGKVIVDGLCASPLAFGAPGVTSAQPELTAPSFTLTQSPPDPQGAGTRSNFTPVPPRTLFQSVIASSAGVYRADIAAGM